MLISRMQLMGAKQRRFKEIPIPNGILLGDGTVTDGATVRIRSLTEREMTAFEMSNLVVTKSRDKVLVSEASMEAHRRRLVAMVLVDENDNPLLSPDDREALAELDGLLVSVIYTEACKHCGLKDRDDQSSEKN